MPAYIPPQERIFKNSIPEPNTGCWLWLGCVDKDGYSKVSGTTGHKLSYLTFKGSVPDGFDVDHKCRVRCCVNPDHLRAISHQDNVAYGIHPKETHANASKTHCKRGHPLSGDNLFVEAYGARKCKICRNANQQARYRKNVNPNAIAKRLRTHCPQGHEYTEENTHFDKLGWRSCRACWRAQKRKKIAI